MVAKLGLPPGKNYLGIVGVYADLRNCDRYEASFVARSKATFVSGESKRQRKDKVTD
jgi:hypothetical protein